jgi:hypothetical protein
MANRVILDSAGLDICAPFATPVIVRPCSVVYHALESAKERFFTQRPPLRIRREFCHFVEGNGMHLIRLAAAVWASCFAIQVSGCVSSEQMDAKLRTRASFDLDCPSQDLEIMELDTATRGVSGCGRHASYIGLCQNFECTWVQQGAARDTD